MRTMAAPGRRGRNAPAAIATAFRIGRNTVLMRGRAEAGETLIIGVRLLNLLAIRDRARFGKRWARSENGKHQGKSESGAAKAPPPLDQACRGTILN